MMSAMTLEFKATALNRERQKHLEAVWAQKSSTFEIGDHVLAKRLRFHSQLPSEEI